MSILGDDWLKSVEHGAVKILPVLSFDLKQFTLSAFVTVDLYLLWLVVNKLSMALVSDMESKCAGLLLKA